MTSTVVAVHHMELMAVEYDNEYDARARIQQIASRRQRRESGIACVAAARDARSSRRNLSCGSGRDPVARTGGGTPTDRAAIVMHSQFLTVGCPSSTRLDNLGALADFSCTACER